MGKTTVIYVKFLRDVACEKLLKSANVSRSYSKKLHWHSFFETRCINFYADDDDDDVDVDNQ